MATHFDRMQTAISKIIWYFFLKKSWSAKTLSKLSSKLIIGQHLKNVAIQLNRTFIPNSLKLRMRARVANICVNTLLLCVWRWLKNTSSPPTPTPTLTTPWVSSTYSNWTERARATASCSYTTGTASLQHILHSGQMLLLTVVFFSASLLLLILLP